MDLTKYVGHGQGDYGAVVHLPEGQCWLLTQNLDGVMIGGQCTLTVGCSRHERDLV